MQHNDKRKDGSTTWVSPVSALNQPFVFSDKKTVDSSLFIDKHSVINQHLDATSTLENSRINKRQGFRIGELNLMIRYEDGSELSEMPRVYPIPNAPPWFDGFCEMHGVLIPVFHLKNYFDVSYAEATNTSKKLTHPSGGKGNTDSHVNQTKPMLLVLEHHDNATGIVVDGLLKRLEYQKEQLQENTIAPTQLLNSISASYLIDEELWFDLDVMGFLDSLEHSVSSM